MRRWNEVSGVVKLWRWVIHVMPAYLVALCRVLWWLVHGASRLTIPEANLDMTRWETACHIWAVTMNLAWVNAGDYQTSEEFIERLKDY